MHLRPTSSSWLTLINALNSRTSYRRLNNYQFAQDCCPVSGYQKICLIYNGIRACKMILSTLGKCTTH
ncbi:hypothetical protein C8Q79DRAFT_544931 [Trametes meyenii]|nr:hypothetical protein C8Q79DRAFT_544931 [Trametes meyenii]